MTSPALLRLRSKLRGDIGSENCGLPESHIIVSCMVFRDMKCFV